MATYTPEEIKKGISAHWHNTNSLIEIKDPGTVDETVRAVVDPQSVRDLVEAAVAQNMINGAELKNAGVLWRPGKTPTAAQLKNVLGYVHKRL